MEKWPLVTVGQVLLQSGNRPRKENTPFCFCSCCWLPYVKLQMFLVIIVTIIHAFLYLHNCIVAGKGTPKRHKRQEVKEPSCKETQVCSYPITIATFVHTINAGEQAEGSLHKQHWHEFYCIIYFTKLV